jgi:Fic family protein
MIYGTPGLAEDLQARLSELEELRRQLGRETAYPSPWIGTLRRQVRAASVESSVSIEGFELPAGEVESVVAGAASGVEESDENRLAVASYARAMDHVGVMALDPVFEWSDRVILDLHFDACYFQRDKSPGHWRTGPSGVTAPDGTLAYQAPDAEQVVPLMGEVADWLRVTDPAEHVVVRAAMAHLHVVSVHPFRDGNGRVSRIVQSLVLARDGLLSPEFGSIEEYLASHTPKYYAVLQEVQGGHYQPTRDATPWIGFCIDAHLDQSRQRLRQVETASARWRYLERLVQERGWPDRLVIALEQSLIGGADRSSYETEADVSPATASADFRRLLDAGLVSQRGRGPTTRYHASEKLRSELDDAVEDQRDWIDPSIDPASRPSGDST